MKFKNPETAELDLSDQATVEQILNSDVLKPVQDKQLEATEKAISNLKPVKVTIELLPAEHAVVTRQAEILGLTVKQFLHKQLKELLVDQSVGKALISGPSNLSGNKVGKVSGPTGSVTRADYPSTRA